MNKFYIFFAQYHNKIISLLTFSAWSFHLSISDLGLYTLITGILSFLVVLIQFSLDDYYCFNKEGRGELNSIYSTQQYVTLFLFILSGFFLIFSQNLVFIILFLWLLIRFLQNQVHAYELHLWVQCDYKIHSHSQLYSKSLGFVVLLFLLYKDVDLYAIPIVFLFESVFLSIFFRYKLNLKINLLGKFNFQIFKANYLNGIKKILERFSSNLDIYLCQFYFGSEILGIYSFARKGINYIYEVFITPNSRLYGPQISKSNTLGLSAFVKSVLDSMRGVASSIYYVLAALIPILGFINIMGFDFKWSRSFEIVEFALFSLYLSPFLIFSDQILLSKNLQGQVLSNTMLKLSLETFMMILGTFWGLVGMIVAGQISVLLWAFPIFKSMQSVIKIKFYQWFSTFTKVSSIILGVYYFTLILGFSYLHLNGQAVLIFWNIPQVLNFLIIHLFFFLCQISNRIESE